MKYRGFEIVPHYSIGADWKLDKDGRVISRKPTKKDVEWYDIIDPLNDGKRWISEDTVDECKKTIDAFLKKAGLSKNC